MRLACCETQSPVSTSLFFVAMNNFKVTLCPANSMLAHKQRHFCGTEAQSCAALQQLGLVMAQKQACEPRDLCR